MLVHEFGGKLAPDLEQNMLYTKSLQMFCTKRIFMLTYLRYYATFKVRKFESRKLTHLSRGVAKI